MEQKPEILIVGAFCQRAVKGGRQKGGKAAHIIFFGRFLVTISLTPGWSAESLPVHFGR